VANATTTMRDPAEWFMDWASGGLGQTFGPAVNERNAMAVSAVHRCVSLRAGIVATLPLKVYRRTEEGRQEAPEHRLSRLFKVAPFPGRPVTSFIWRETLQSNIDLWCDHFAAIRYDNAGRVVGIEPLLPWLVEVYRRAGRNLYHVTHDDGAGEWIDQEDMIHIPGLGFDGVRGMSRIRYNARDAIALAKVLEQQTGVAHDNGAFLSGLLTLPPKISDDGLKRLKAQFQAAYQGRANTGRVFFADDGMKFEPMQLSPVDLATIDSRRFQVADISRFFGVPIHLLNETDKSTSWGSGLAEQNMAFLAYSMDADLSRIEAELNYKLFDGSDFYAEFDRDGILAMDPLRAAEVAQKEIASGTLLPNEYRRAKNRPPIEGGDEPLINSTNVPLSRQLAPPEPAVVAPEGPADA
jgi:HK97 family phage portal protein